MLFYVIHLILYRY